MRRYAEIFFVSAGCAICIYVAWSHGLRSELTQMQAFQKWWHYNAVAAIFLAIGFSIGEKK